MLRPGLFEPQETCVDVAPFGAGRCPRFPGEMKPQRGRPPGYSSSTILSASPLEVFAMGSPSRGFRATFAP